MQTLQEVRKMKHVVDLAFAGFILVVLLLAILAILLVSMMFRSM